MIPDPFIRHQTGVDCLREGYFVLRRPDRIDVPIWIWFGPPSDPETQEPLDRSWRWQARVGFVDVEEEPFRVGRIWIREWSDIWPACARIEIDQAEYEYMIARAAWAVDYNPNDPFAEFGSKVDPLTCELP